MIATGLPFASIGADAQLNPILIPFGDDSRARSSSTPGPYTIVSGVKYGPRADQLVDLLYPAHRTPLGVIVWAHGGGWVAGDRRQARTQFITRWLIDQGWVIASFDYRLTKASRGGQVVNSYPAAIEDAQVALRWVERNVSRRNFGRKVLLGGWSAGGNIAVMSSVVDPSRSGAGGTPVRVDGVLSVGGITDMWAMYKVQYTFYSFIAAGYVHCRLQGQSVGSTKLENCDDKTLRARLAEASVAHHVRRALRNAQFIPPVYLIAGEKDRLVRPDTQAVEIARLWAQLAGSSEMAETDVMKNGAHDPAFGQFDDGALRDWLGNIRAGRIVPYRETHFQCHFLSRRSCVSMYGLARL